MIDYLNHLEERLGSCKKIGRGNVMINCPFHGEDTPSCSVSIETGGFNCFGCGKSGPFYVLISEIDGVSEFTSRLMLYDDFNYSSTLENIKNSLKNKEENKKRYIKWESFLERYPELTDKYKGYILKRKLDLQIANKFLLRSGVGGKWEDRLIFPIRNIGGKLVGFSGRHIFKNESHIKTRKEISYDKAINDVLYGFYENLNIIKKLRYLYIVEGEIDTIYISKFDIPVVGRLGKNKLSLEQILKIIKVCDKVFICYDGDSPGVDAAKKEYEVLSKYINSEIVNIPEGKDPNGLSDEDVLKIFKRG